MSFVTTKDADDTARKIDTFQRTEGPDTVETQAVAVIDPGTGHALAPTAQGRMPIEAAALPLPTGAATQATLAALNIIAAAVQSAVEAINAKTTAVNTSAVAGTVALDGPTLAALETINANTGGLTDAQLRATPLSVSGTFWQATQPVSFTWAGLTDAQLRATALPVSLASAPLPTGAATEATLAALAGVVKAEDSPSADGDAGLVLLAQRRDSDTTAVSADGDYATLKTDEAGRLKVSTQPASYVVGAGNITANGQAIFLNVERASNVTINMVATSLAGHNATFEYSHNSTNGTDGNWYGVQAVRSNANTVETATGVLAATPAYGWELSVNAYKWVRVRATAHTSGTAAYTITPGAYATEPIPAVQVTGTQPVSGTVTATVGTSINGGTISPLTVAGSSAEASSAKTASGNSAAGLTNASGRNAHFIVNVSASGGTSPTLVVRVQIQDPVSSAWVDLPGAATGTITGNGATLLSVNNLPRTYRLAWVIGGTTPSFTFSVGYLPVI